MEAARRAMAQVGGPIGVTGPTWQMTNVKAAAIVNQKYDHVDDYICQANIKIL